MEREGHGSYACV